MRRIILSIILALTVPVALSAQDWIEHIIGPNLDGACSVHAKDIDRDGDMDILSANTNLTPSCVIWWENDSVGNFTKHVIDSSFTSAKYYMTVYGTQLNEDEYVDILTAGSGIAWWKNDSNENFSRYGIGSLSLCYSLFAADVNGDGYMDVLGTSATYNDIYWWKNVDGSGTSWVKDTIDADIGGAMSVCAIDINGDSAIDILGAGWSEDSICWWENMEDDPLTFTKHTIAVGADGNKSVFAIDMDDDGDADVLGANGTGSILLWENLDGSGMSWEEHYVGGLGDVQSVIAIDMNEDNVMDVVAGGDGIAYFINDGDENFTQYFISGLSSIYEIDACDLDNDEDIDVMGASFSGDKIVWWENALSDTNDVGPYSIDIPDIIPLDTTFKPQATVTNFGNKAQSYFVVTCVINDPGTYTSTKGIQYLAPYASIQVEFPLSFKFDVHGSYTVIVYTRLTDDDEPANDTLAKVIATLGIAEGGVNTPETFNFTVPTISKGKTNVTLALPVATKVDLLVYDVLGRLSKTVVSESFSAGIHSIPVEFDLPAGVYFYSLKTESGRNIVKKFLLIE